MGNKYIKLIKDTLVYAIGGIGSKMILFFLVPLYTNYLSTEEYGTADLIFTVSQLIVPFIGVVIQDAVVRFALSKEEQRENVLLSSLIVWFVGSLASVLITPLIGLYEPVAPWKWHLCIYMMINMMLLIGLNYIKAKERNKLYSAISIVQTFTMAVSNILLIAVFPLGVDGYVTANILGNLVAVVGIFIFGGIIGDLKRARLSLPLMKRMLLFSAPLILNNVSWWAIYSANKVIVELALGASVLGIYTVATKLPSLINVVISIFQQSWGISTVKEIESSNDTKFYSNIFGAFSFIAFAMSFGLILIIKPLMSVYVGDDFFIAWKYVPLLLAGATFSAISSFFVSLYAALKKSLNNMLTTLIGAVINVAACMLLINYVDLWGAVIATFLAYFVMATVRMIDVLRYIKIEICLPRFIINCTLLIADAVLVSLNVQIYLVAAVSLLLFLLVNMSLLKSLASLVFGRKRV